LEDSRPVSCFLIHRVALVNYYGSHSPFPQNTLNMFPFKKTIFLVLAALCLSGSARAQLQTTAMQTVPQSADVSATAFRLTNVTIGSQTFLIAQDTSTTGEEDNGVVADHCLVTMLNFFLEVPATKK
jgi:hypothetical protein